MLVWLASYPRSGNTLVRVALNDAFGIKTRSLAGDGDDRVFSARPGVVEAVGHLKSETRGLDLIEEAQRSDELYILKTHEPPTTDDPAIYIVRDGRSVVVSYYHYLNDVEKLTTSIEAVIAGEVYAGSWSDHFEAWQPFDRPKTLMLRFENISKNTRYLIQQLGGFLSMQPRLVTPSSFEYLHRLHPAFFRKGDDESNICTLQPHIHNFMEHHRALMVRLNYDLG